MKRVLILGAGTAGTIMANKLARVNQRDFSITVIERNSTHYYQPGFLLLPFGMYSIKDVVKSLDDYMPKDVTLVVGNGVEKIIPETNEVVLENGDIYGYDCLIIAAGVRLSYDDPPGLADGFDRNIFDFYTYSGSTILRDKLRGFKEGRLVMSIIDLPFKCPVAPIEFVCLADAYFTKRGIRDRVKISLTTPLAGAFTKPIASKMLGGMISEKNIEVIPNFQIDFIDNKNKKLVGFDGRNVSYDLLTIVPLNYGPEFVGRTGCGLGDDLDFVDVDRNTLQSCKHPNIFAIGDCNNAPVSKSGSAIRYASDALVENVFSVLEGRHVSHKYDGHMNCFVESGFGKASMVDYNYDSEPYPGVYPYSWGPFSLLRNTQLNHWGKLLLKWFYWYFILRGR